jgi:hypothetical protein
MCGVWLWLCVHVWLCGCVALLYLCGARVCAGVWQARAARMRKATPVFVHRCRVALDIGGVMAYCREKWTGVFVGLLTVQSALLCAQRRAQSAVPRALRTALLLTARVVLWRCSTA